MQNKKIRIAIVGYGNIGKYLIDSIPQTPDCEIAGIVRRSILNSIPQELQGLPVVTSIKDLDRVDVAILSSPTRSIQDFASEILSCGIATVDSYDIHTGIVDLRKQLDSIAKAHNTVAILSAGWDPGSDSVVRMLMQAMLPQGITYTNFGPGMSMGHTVAAKAVSGVEKALSMTIPLGTGVHRRMVYVQPCVGANFQEIKEQILKDDYFAHDETHVIETSDVDALIDMGHGVDMERKGASGKTQNQRVRFQMSINNPALTAQIMIASARAAMRQERKGAYTLPEIPVIDLLPGDREEWIARLC